MDLAAGATKILVVVEGLPEGQKRLGSRFGTGIQQDADLGVEDPTKGVEQPTMRVDLLAVLLLQAEDHLNRR